MMSTVIVPGVIVMEFARRVFAKSDFRMVLTFTMPGFIGMAG